MLRTLQRYMDRSAFVGTLRREEEDLDIRLWRLNGRPSPPPTGVKRQRIREIAMAFECRTFIETGTYMGDTVQSMLSSFDHLHSIELAPFYATRARNRFRGRSQVTIHEGDSAVLLPRILADVKCPALIWLDAHYCGGVTATSVPLATELATIPNINQHCILIDDAHMLGTPGYPTVDELSATLARFPNHAHVTMHNVVEITPTSP